MDRLLEATARAERDHFWFRGFRRFVTPLLHQATGGRSSIRESIAAVKDSACTEAEKANIAQQTESDIDKMRQQAESEINRLTQQVRAELRRYSAEESVRLAEEKLRAKINADNDAVLVKSGIQAIGGLN